MLTDPHALVVLDGIEQIGPRRYQGTDYERVFIPKSVVSICDSAFSNCRKLREVVVEDGSRLQMIGRGAFSGCVGLASINLPEGLEKICVSAFRGAGLQDV